MIVVLCVLSPRFWSSSSNPMKKGLKYMSRSHPCLFFRKHSILKENMATVVVECLYPRKQTTFIHLLIVNPSSPPWNSAEKVQSSCFHLKYTRSISVLRSTHTHSFFFSFPLSTLLLTPQLLFRSWTSRTPFYNCKYYNLFFLFLVMGRYPEIRFHMHGKRDEDTLQTNSPIVCFFSYSILSAIANSFYSLVSFSSFDTCFTTTLDIHNTTIRL